MSGFVLEASVAAAWLLDDEEETLSNAALARLETEEALVPQLWHVEIRSALLGAERSGRIRSDEVDERLRSLGDLPVRTDTDPRLGLTLALARAHGLSIYDAMYLELAQRLDASLATLDKDLARTCRAAGLLPDWDPRT